MGAGEWVSRGERGRGRRSMDSGRGEQEEDVETMTGGQATVEVGRLGKGKVGWEEETATRACCWR